MVTTIGATLIYGLISAASIKLGRKHREHRTHRAGVLGGAITLGFGLYLLAPDLRTTGTTAWESCFFIVWAVLSPGCFLSGTATIASAIPSSSESPCFR